MFAPTTKVLICDDMLTMRMIIKKTLTTLGFTSISDFSDGAKAWAGLEDAAAKGEPFQLILSDWNMPNMTGIDLLKKVRGDERFKALPFLLITAENEKSQVMEAIQAGVSQYVVKPFTPEALKEKLESVYKKMNPAA